MWDSESFFFKLFWVRMQKLSEKSAAQTAGKVERSCHTRAIRIDSKFLFSPINKDEGVLTSVLCEFFLKLQFYSILLEN